MGCNESKAAAGNDVCQDDAYKGMQAQAEEELLRPCTEEEIEVEPISAMQGLISLFERRIPSDTSHASKVEVQQMSARQLSTVERNMLKYSGLGQIFMDGTCAAVKALPFGEPLAALLGLVYRKTVQVAKNSRNCNTLLINIKRCDRQLQSVMLLMGKKSSLGGFMLSPDMRSGLWDLAQVIQKAAKIILQYNEQGCVRRFLTSPDCTQQFKNLERDLMKAMTWATFAVGMGSLESKYTDEGAAVREAICAAASEPDPTKAIEKLSREDPALLRQLIKEHSQCTFSEQLIQQDIDAVSKELREHALKLRQHSIKLSHVEKALDFMAQSINKADHLAEWLEAWWKKAFGRREDFVDWADFKAKLKETLEDTISECNSDLKKKAEKLKINLAQVCSSDDVFIDLAVRKVLDTDLIERARDLTTLETSATQCAAELRTTAPANMDDLMDLIYRGYVIKDLVVSMSIVVVAITTKLKVSEVIQSYAITNLTKDYIPTTRMWIFEEIMQWQKAQQSDEAVSRMFLLLAGAGMGKSVCSAVMISRLQAAAAQEESLVVAHHFFKAGQPRGEGRTAVLCLVHQLCHSLEGLAGHVKTALDDVEDLQALDLPTTFEKLLLGPMICLHNERYSKASGKKPPCCLLLMDALDESDYKNQGYQQVCNLVASSFLLLPEWVCVLVTGRPHIEEAFKAWTPVCIDAKDKRNQEDLRKVIALKLEKKLEKLVAAADMEGAVDLLVKKSKGQLIYTNYVLLDMEKERLLWTLDQIAKELPEGLAGFYQHYLDYIADAMQQDEQTGLLRFLKTQLLPVLSVMREALTAPVLAWLTQGTEEDVDLLLRLLYPLFPKRRANDGTATYPPHHKSVTDFLLGYADNGERSQSSCDWVTPARYAHFLFVSRLLPEALRPSMQHWKDACEQQMGPTDAIRTYLVKHLPDHISLCKHWPALHQLAAKLPAFKGFLEAGQVYKLIEVLVDATQDGNGLSAREVEDLQSVHRFLRSACNLIVADVHSVLQEVACAPHACALHVWCEKLFGAPSLTNKAPAFWRNAIGVRKLAADFPPEIGALQGHTGNVWCCALSRTAVVLNQHAIPGSKEQAEEQKKGSFLVVSGSEDKTLRVWDIATGQLYSTLQGHGEDVNCCALSQDGHTLVSGSADMTLKVWDVATGKLRSTLQAHSGGVNCCALTSDGATLVTGSTDTTLKVWNLSAGTVRRTLKGHGDAVRCCSLSPDGATLVSGSLDKTLKVWDMTDGKLRASLDQHTGGVLCCKLSYNGTLLVSGSADKTLKVWDLATGNVRNTLEGHQGVVFTCTVSRDNKTLVSGSADKTLKVWNLSTGQLRCTLDGHRYGVYACALSHDGRTLVSGSNDNTLKVWDLSTGQLNKHEGHTDSVNCCVLSQDGTTRVSGSADKTLKVWDVATGHMLRELPGHTGIVHCCALSANGGTLVTGSADKTLKVWEMATGKLHTTLEGHMGDVRCCAISGDGATLVSASHDKSLKVWALQPREPGKLQQTLRSGMGMLWCCALSHDGKICVTGSSDKAIRVWDLATGTVRSTLEDHNNVVNCCALSRNGTLLVSGSADKTLKVWDLATGKVRHTLGHQGSVMCCSLSQDGTTLVSGSADNATMVWDVATGKLRSTLQAHSGGVNCCALSPDGKTLVTGSTDTTLKVVAVPTLPSTCGFHQASAFHTWYKKAGMSHLEFI